MAFTLPTFNLQFQAVANYTFAGVGNPAAGFILIATPCNLAFSPRKHEVSSAGIASMYLLFPTGIPLKGPDSYALQNGDAVEVPMGSGRWYTTMSVDRVAAGFPNAHQAATLVHPKSKYPTTTALWPAP